MALTRAFLKSMGLNEEQVSAIIEAHSETVNGLKTERDKYKVDAEKLPSVQQQLDTLKSDGTDWKGKYEKEHSDFETYKTSTETARTNAAKTAALRTALKAAGVGRDEFAELLLGKIDMSAVELDGENVKNAAAIIDPLKSTFAGCFGTVENHGAPANNPPSGGNTNLSDLSDEDYYKAVYDKKK